MDQVNAAEQRGQGPRGHQRDNQMSRSLILILLICFTGFSCVTQRRCLEKFPLSNDTIRIIEIRDTIILRDTTIFIHLPGESRTDSVLIPCPPPPGPYIPDTARAETSLAAAAAWWDYPSIKLRLIQKDTTIEARLKDAIREISHWRNEYEKILQVRTLKKIPGIYKAALFGWIGVIVIIIMLIIIKKFTR